MHGRRRRRGLAVSVVVGAWGVALLAVTVLLLRQGAQKAAEWAAILGGLTALAGLMEPQIERIIARAADRKSGGASQVDLAAGLQRVAEQLAGVVRSQWRDEEKMRRLQDPWPLPLQWAAAEEDLSDHPEVVFKRFPQGSAHSVVGPAALSGHLAEVADLYERLPGKRLVVLGPQGSGKSVFAMTLALAILDRWQPGMQVPVLFPVASWDPSRKRLTDWLLDYLFENYQLSGGNDQGSRAVGRGLLEHNMLLPILDGLDEVPEAHRPIGIRDLNRELDAAQPVVLTCRTDEYRKAVEMGDVLTLAAVVELQPLPLAAVIRYLTETTPAGARARRWAPVFERLRTDPDGALASVLRTPLMVFLTRAIYGDNLQDPSELLDQRYGDPTSIEDHLLSQLIPATYQNRTHRQEYESHWQADDVTSWLTYLATRVAGPGRPDLAWWQLERAVPAIVIDVVGSIQGGLVVAFVFGPVFGIVFTAAAVLAGTLARSRPWTLEAWLGSRFDSWNRRLAAKSAVWGIVATLIGLTEKVPIERRIALAVGRFTAIAAGLAYGIVVYSHHDLFHALASGLAVGLAGGLAVGFFTISLRTTPSEVQFAGKKGVAAFLRHLATGFAIGVGFGIVVDVLAHSGLALLAVVLTGLVVGLIDGLNVWLDVPTDVTCALSPRSTRRAERIAAVTRSLAVGALIAATSGLAFGLANGAGSGIAHGLVFGIGYGLADRYMGLSSTVWGRYIVAKTWLALSGRLPWRLMALMDDAHASGLLRRVGAAYQFRHARLQEYLASAQVKPSLVRGPSTP